MQPARVLVAILGVSAAWAAETMYPVPKGAFEIEHVAPQAGTYEEDHFFLTEAYPGTAALKFYSTLFADWRSCHAANDGWQSFPEASGFEHRFVHVLIQHWISPQNDVAVTLVLRFESPGPAVRAVPSSTRQFVTVTRLRHVDAEKELARIGVTCASSS